MRWLTRWSRWWSQDDKGDLAEEIRLIHARLEDLATTLADFDERLTAVTQRTHPDRTTMQWEGTPGE